MSCMSILDTLLNPLEPAEGAAAGGEVAAAAGRVEADERQIIACCQSPDFSVEKLKEVWKRLRG